MTIRKRPWNRFIFSLVGQLSSGLAFSQEFVLRLPIYPPPKPNREFWFVGPNPVRILRLVSAPQERWAFAWRLRRACESWIVSFIEFQFDRERAVYLLVRCWQHRPRGRRSQLRKKPPESISMSMFQTLRIFVCVSVYMRHRRV